MKPKKLSRCEMRSDHRRWLAYVVAAPMPIIGVAVGLYFGVTSWRTAYPPESQVPGSESGGLAAGLCPLAGMVIGALAGIIVGAMVAELVTRYGQKLKH
jgi:hypothetical protein